jgi:hypothetical protein
MKSISEEYKEPIKEQIEKLKSSDLTIEERDEIKNEIESLRNEREEKTREAI